MKAFNGVSDKSIKGLESGSFQALFSFEKRGEKQGKKQKKDSVAHLGVPHCLNVLIVSASGALLTKFQICRKTPPAIGEKSVPQLGVPHCM